MKNKSAPAPGRLRREPPAKKRKEEREARREEEEETGAGVGSRQEKRVVTSAFAERHYLNDTPPQGKAIIAVDRRRADVVGGDYRRRRDSQSVPHALIDAVAVRHAVYVPSSSSAPRPRRPRPTLAPWCSQRQARSVPSDAQARRSAMIRCGRTPRLTVGAV